jgi:hypothetical protein
LRFIYILLFDFLRFTAVSAAAASSIKIVPESPVFGAVGAGAGAGVSAGGVSAAGAEASGSGSGSGSAAAVTSAADNTI